MASTTPQEAEASFFSTLSSFFMPTAHAAGPQREIDGGEGGDDAQGKQLEGDKDEEEEAEEAPEEEEEEEEEPEDVAPGIRQACQETECVKPAEHFKHCSDKVEAGKGWHGEDCVEELFHLMHCVDSCSAPKIFKKLA